MSSAAFAESPQDNYWAGLEYFYPTIKSTARLDATATPRPGTTLSLEDDLDLSDRKGTPYVDLGMRLGQRWRLEFEYYTLNRNATKAITREIDFGDASFPVGTNLSSTFDSTIYRLTGGWSFVRRAEAEAGLSLGVHVTDFKTQLAGQGTGLLAGTGFQREARNRLVPLPTVGLYGTYAVLPQLLVRGRIDLLSLSYDDYDGRLLNAMLALNWRFAKNVGAGVGYRYVDYRLGASKPNFQGEIEYRFRGPTFFVNVGF